MSASLFCRWTINLDDDDDAADDNDIYAMESTTLLCFNIAYSCQQTVAYVAYALSQS